MICPAERHLFNVRRLHDDNVCTPLPACEDSACVPVCRPAAKFFWYYLFSFQTFTYFTFCAPPPFLAPVMSL